MKEEAGETLGIMFKKMEEDKKELVSNICSQTGLTENSEVFKFLELSQWVKNIIICAVAENRTYWRPSYSAVVSESVKWSKTLRMKGLGTRISLKLDAIYITWNLAVDWRAREAAKILPPALLMKRLYLL